jgi:hypothetical protein
MRTRRSIAYEILRLFGLKWKILIHSTEFKHAALMLWTQGNRLSISNLQLELIAISTFKLFETIGERGLKRSFSDVSYRIYYYL